MNKHSFFLRAKCTALSACKLILFSAAFLTAASFAQEKPPVDLSISPGGYLPSRTITLGQDTRIGFYVFIEARREASGVIVTAELPEGINPLSISTDTGGQCSYIDNLVTCNLGVVGKEGSQARDFVASVDFRVKPTSVGTITVMGRITANESDPNFSNNTALTTLIVKKSTKRVRFF